MQYILALDQGTTSSRAIVFDREGRQVAVAQREFQQIFPQPGWVEHDAREIWATQHAVALEAMENAGAGRARPEDFAAIGITNQRETTLLWDRATGHPVANAIVWQDRRTAARCRELDPELIRRKAGLVPDPYFSATKLEWLLREHGSSDGLAFGTVDSF